MPKKKNDTLKVTEIKPKKKVTTKKKTAKKETPKKEIKVEPTLPIVDNKKEIVKEELEKTGYIITEQGDKYYDIIGKEKHQSLKKLIITIIVLVFISLAIYFFVILNPKMIFMSGLNKGSNYINQTLKFFEDNPYFNTPLKIDTTTKGANNLDIDASLEIDAKKHILNTYFKYNQGNESLSLNQYNGDNSYIEFKDLYPHILKYSDENNLINKVASYINYVDFTELNKGYHYIFNLIKKELFNMNYTKNKEKDLCYVSLNLSKEDFNKVLANIIANIKSKDSIINSLSNSFNTSKENIINFLDNLAKDALRYNFNNIEIRFYYNEKLATVYGSIIKIDNKEIFKSLDNSIILNINDNVIKFSDNVIRINKLVLNINEFNKNRIDINYNYEDYKGNIHLNISKLDNKNIHGIITFTITGKNNTSYEISFNIKNNVNNITLPSEYKDVYNLSEDDYLELHNNVNHKINDKQIRNFINSILEGLINN